MAGLDFHTASPGEIARRLAPENLHAKAVQGRHKQEQMRNSSSSVSGIDAMIVDPPDHPSGSTSGTGSVDAPTHVPSGRVSVSFPQQRSPSWGTFLYQLAEKEKANEKGFYSVTDVTSSELYEAPFSSSANDSGTPTGQTSVSVSLQHSPDWRTCRYHLVHSEKKAARQQRNGSERVAPSASASNEGLNETTIKEGLPRSIVVGPPVLPFSAQSPTGTGPNHPHKDTKRAAQTSSLWGIDFALENGLFPQSSGPTPSSGTASRLAVNTASSMPAPPPSSNAPPISAEPNQALNGVPDQTMSEGQVAELEEFLLELDKVAGAQIAIQWHDLDIT